ncbi:MAG: hypothetical protein ABI780_03685 [Ardenticatenales bacterium]
MSHLDPAASNGAGCLRTLAIFALVASPVYLLLRVVARTARQLYGFDPPPDEPPLVVCARCHNTVLDHGWSHCPYCGAPLPEASATNSDLDAIEGADRSDDEGREGIGRRE